MGRRRVRLKLTAVLLDDTHLGSGLGGAGVDALVARDRDGQPVLWATHLEGLLREAAQRLNLDSTTITRLFGHRGGSRQLATFTSLYVTSESGPSRVWRSSARESFDNRAPRADTLRAVEFIPKGTKLQGFVELPSSDVVTLKTLFHHVDAIGHGKSTGSGKVRFELAEQNPPSQPFLGKVTAGLRLLLKNIDPVCIAATAMPGNLIPTLSYIPGRTLLGAVTQWLLDQGTDEAVVVAKHLVRGNLSVSDALPVPDTLPSDFDLGSVEVLPAPRSLTSVKPLAQAGDVPWWAGPTCPPGHVNVLGAGVSADNSKSLAADVHITRVPGQPWRVFQPLIRVRLRHSQPDVHTPQVSLFAIEHIAERTGFVCEFSGDKPLMEMLRDALKPLVEERGWLRVGRGGAAVEIERSAWINPQKPMEFGGIAYVTLTSDVLIRDPLLRWVTHLDTETLGGAVDWWPNDVRITASRQGAVPIHGFNGTSRLWRLPSTAVRRGTVLVVEGKNIRALAAAAAEGRWLGERTHEGFGRFRVDSELPGLDTATVPAIVDSGTPPVPVDNSATLEKAVAATQKWARVFHEKTIGSTMRQEPSGPGLTQWETLVTELYNQQQDALSSRLNPTTAGKVLWKHPTAKKILQRLDEKPPKERHLYAELFVRWYRTHLKNKETL